MSKVKVQVKAYMQRLACLYNSAEALLGTHEALLYHALIAFDVWAVYNLSAMNNSCRFWLPVQHCCHKEQHYAQGHVCHAVVHIGVTHALLNCLPQVDAAGSSAALGLLLPHE